MDHGVKCTMRRALAGAGFAGVMLATALPAVAQVRGLPVYNSGVARGIGIAADVGFPNDDAGKGLGYGVTGSAGMGLLGVTATVAAFNPDGPGGSETTLGATANMRMFGGPLVPLSVTLQGGVGYLKADAAGSQVTDWHFPVGVGFALTIPNPALAIKPWLAPRIDIVRQSVETDGPVGISETDTETNFGLSAGIDFNFLNGLGVRAAYDYVAAGEGRTIAGSDVIVMNDRKPGVFGFGLHYMLRVPTP